MMKRLLILTILITLTCAACQTQPAPSQPDPNPEAEAPSPEPFGAIEGTLLSASPDDTLSGRPVMLCEMQPDDSCRLLDAIQITGDGGHFTFDDLTPGEYAFVMDAGLGDFEDGAARMAGELLRPGDWAWVRGDLLALPEGAAANIRIPAGIGVTGLDRTAYALQTLMFDGAPFVVAHRLTQEDNAPELTLITAAVRAGEITTAALPVPAPAPIDYDAIRAEIGPLTYEELAIFDRTLSERWGRFIEGEDGAYRDTDADAITAMRAGLVHAIGQAQITALEEFDGDLVKSTGYLTIDVQSGDEVVIGWLDTATGDVIEASTGYRLNVRDDPGIWIETGTEGEEFYRYGFTYYRDWGQILPDPFIAVVEAFYSEGIAYVAAAMVDYRAAAENFGGDLLLVDWDDSTLAQMAAWQPSAPPFVHFPDSGTVDVRRERFMEAITTGEVILDEASLQSYLRSSTAQNSPFNPAPDPQDVRDALLTPYRSGHLFSDLEAAIILDATYNGPEGPLTLYIAGGLDEGFSVPARRDDEIRVARTEVADVLLGYPGALNSRWAHEMGHIVDFRSEQYTFRGRPTAGSRCEPGKYLMEFMWWVQRYPGDAPGWDWMPINSGLTLARLLTESFHNSGC